MPKISIIIPVYNVEEYLRECLDSVINQTLEDIEIICINDGSTDNSLNILNEYVLKDKRIKVLTQENSGVGSARNLGIDIAKGEYISFIDPDDFINNTFYENLYTSAHNNNAELAFCNCKKIYSSSQKDEWYEFTNKNRNLKDWTTSTVWFFIYKREFNLRFDTSIINGEDDLFSFLLFKKIKSFSYSENSIYYYRQRTSGASQDIKNKSKSLTGRIKIIRTIIKLAYYNNQLFKESPHSFYETLIMEFNTLLRYQPLNKEETLKLLTLLKELLFIPHLKETRTYYKLISLGLKIIRKNLITFKISVKGSYFKIFNKELIRIGG